MLGVGSSAWFFNLNFLWFFFILLLINHGVLFVEGAADCTVSCGKLNNISFPFRVRDDPKYRGDADYELFCEGGEAFFYRGAHKYLVTQINYYDGDSSSLNWTFSSDGTKGYMTIHVDCPFTKSICSLHHNSSDSSPSFTHNSGYGASSWASFMQCSEKMSDASCNVDSYCTRVFTVPSLDGENTTAYIVVGFDANGLSHLHKSCKFVDTFLFRETFLLGDHYVNSSKQVIEALQQGFNRSWAYNSHAPTNCWTYALWVANDIKGENSFSYQILILHRFDIDIVYNFFSCLALGSKARQLSHSVVENILVYITSIPVIILVVLLELATVFRFVLAPLTVCVYLVYNYWKNTKPMDSIDFFLQKQQLLLPRRYTYGGITAMTRHFKEKLGKGGFGQVYKGELFGGHLSLLKSWMTYSSMDKISSMKFLRLEQFTT